MATPQNLSPHNYAVNLDESLAKGHTSPWAAWRCLNRLRTGVACSKEQRKRWKYFNGDTTCECGQAPKTTKHMFQCPLLAHPCTLDDLQKFNENARKCVDKWKNAVWWHERRRLLYIYKSLITGFSLFLWWKLMFYNMQPRLILSVWLLCLFDRSCAVTVCLTVLFGPVSLIGTWSLYNSHQINHQCV